MEAVAKLVVCGLVAGAGDHDDSYKGQKDNAGDQGKIALLPLRQRKGYGTRLLLWNSLVSLSLFRRALCSGRG